MVSLKIGVKKKRKRGSPINYNSTLSQLAWASKNAWVLAGDTIFAENGARGKPKRHSGGPESSESGSGAQNGQKCLQNDFFGLKMARNGAGNGQNGLETTKYAKNGEKTAENEGQTTNGANGTNGGGKQGKNYEMLEKRENGAENRK